MYGALPLALWAVSGCNRADARRPQPEPAALVSPAVTIHQPARLGHVRLGEPSQAPAGQSPSAGGAWVKCETCHALRPASVLPASMLELDQFHQGLELEHGDLRCGACHTEGASTTLHLADGRKLPAGAAMQLCAQCHGPQYRDYQHGAHGGMTGHWDLSRGARTRNHCVDCHDPHAPQIRKVIPAPPPRDRFFGQRVAGGAEPRAAGAPHPANSGEEH